MHQNTSVVLGGHFEEFISAQVSSGRYASADEVIRTALQLLETEEFRKGSLEKALIEGEESGFEKDFDQHTNLKKLHSEFL